MECSMTVGSRLQNLTEGEDEESVEQEGTSRTPCYGVTNWSLIPLDSRTVDSRPFIAHFSQEAIFEQLPSQKTVLLDTR